MPKAVEADVKIATMPKASCSPQAVKKKVLIELKKPLHKKNRNARPVGN